MWQKATDSYSQRSNNCVLIIRLFRTAPAEQLFLDLDAIWWQQKQQWNYKHQEIFL